MAWTIDKKAKKVLDKEEARKSINAPPKAPELPTIHPCSPDKNVSVLSALWALPGNPTATLMIVRKKDQKMYEVINYNPVTRILILKSSWCEAEFDTVFTRKIEATYEPFWR